MVELDTSIWATYEIKRLFVITGTKTTSIDKLETYGSGKFPYVTTQAVNNGVYGHYKHHTEAGGVLTVDSAVLGYCSYQASPFSASDHVEKLTPKFNMNQHIGLFIATIINMDNFRYCYGRKYSQKQLKQAIIKLPTVIDDNKKFVIDKKKEFSTEGYIPDWQFMEDYIESLSVSKPKTKNKGELTPKLDTSKWHLFQIGGDNGLFILCKGKNKAATDLEDGSDCYYIVAKKDDNGVMKQVKADKTLMLKGNCIVFIVDGQGSAGYANYVDKDFIGNTHIVAGYNDNLNTYTGAFIVAVCDLERPKYSFGRAWAARLADTKIKLPAVQKGNNSDGTPKYEPDWQYMENYIKSLPYGDILL